MPQADVGHHQKYCIRNIFWNCLPPPRFDFFFEKNEKCLELPAWWVMEMAGKHSDHYFRRWQAKSSDHNKKKFEKNEKNEKCLELPDLARKWSEKHFENFTPPPRFFCFVGKNKKVFELSDLAKRRVSRARTPIGASWNFILILTVEFHNRMLLEKTALQHSFDAFSNKLILVCWN